jgi:hypothetical protein
MNTRAVSLKYLDMCLSGCTSSLVGGERKILADVSSCRSSRQDKSDGH